MAYHSSEIYPQSVTADFARTLERELVQKEQELHPSSDAKPGDVWGAYRLDEDGWWRLTTDPHPAQNQSPILFSERCPACATPSGTPDRSPSVPPEPSDTLPAAPH